VNNQFKLKPIVVALAMIGFIGNVVAADVANDVGEVRIDAQQSFEAVKTSPVQNNLNVSMPEAIVTKEYLENVMDPFSSYAGATNLAPSMQTYTFNGPGGGDEKITLRGFQDGSDMLNLTMDGIPFFDSNDPSHHSQVYFTAPMLGGIVIDRSPGTASVIGSSNFAGTIGLKSKDISNDQVSSAGLMYGSFNTTTENVEYNSGLSKDGTTKWLFGVQQYDTDGFQTYNPQNRTSGYFKLESQLTTDTKLTIFASGARYTSHMNDSGPGTYAVYNLPSSYSQYYKGGGMNYFQSNDPNKQNFWGYGNYNVNTLFNYIGLNSNLGDGWSVDNKLYYNMYNNQEIFDKWTAPDATISQLSSSKGGVNKLNSNSVYGDTLKLTKLQSNGSKLDLGIWAQYSWADRHQYYVNAVTGGTPESGGSKFNEQFGTTIIQPFAQYDYKATEDLHLTPGFKYNIYQINLTQWADNATVGNLNGQPNKKSSATYTDPLPFFDTRYFIQKNWNVYAQFASGDIIPPSSVFDVTGAQVGVTPKPIQTKAYQAGTVYQANNFTTDFDVYQMKANSSYTPVVDPTCSCTNYVAGASQTYKGIEWQGNYVFGSSGFNLYGNASKLYAKYDSGGDVPLVPADMETLGLFYSKDNWKLGATEKRVGPQWTNSSTNAPNNYQLQPMYFTNLSANYVIRDLGSSFFKDIKLRAGVENLFNKIYIYNFTPSGTSSAPGQQVGDFITLTSGRAFYLGGTLSF